jgi:nicotinamidase-related amidase
MAAVAAASGGSWRQLGRLAPQHCVLFLCDVQERFRATIHAMPHVVASSQLLCKAGRVMELPLVTTEQYPKALGSTVREIDTGAGPVFAKTRFSMLTPEVEAHLASLGPERRQAIVYGIEAHVCVYQSCMDLLERGWQVHVVADAVSSSRALYRDVALQRLRQSGCFVTSAEGVLFDLMRDTSFTGFKQVSGLVKEHNAALAALESQAPPALLL